MVAGSLDTTSNWRRVKGRGEHENAGKGGEGGLGVFIEVNQEGITRREFEGRGGGRTIVTWGNMNVAETIHGSRVVNVILRDRT